MTTVDFTLNPIAVTPVAGKSAENMVVAIVGRSTWSSDPMLMAQYSAETGRLLIRIGAQRTGATFTSSDQTIIVGFDDDGHGAWPTVVALEDAQRSLAESSDAVKVAVALLGDSFFVAAREAMSELEAWIEVPLERPVADLLRDVWDSLDVYPATSEDFTDDLLERTLASWSSELMAVSLAPHRTIASNDANAVSSGQESVERSARFTCGIADEETFKALTGRQRGRTEPFLIAEVILDVRTSDLQVSVSITLPAGLSPSGVVSADVSLAGGTWNMILESDPLQPEKLFGSRLLPAEILEMVLGAGVPLSKLAASLAVHVTR